MSLLTSLIKGVVSADPDAPAVEVAGRWRTWRELSGLMRQIDEACGELGLVADDRVAVMMRNRLGPYAALFSVMASGRCLVTLNPLYPAETLAEDIRSLRAPVVLGEAADLSSREVRQAITEVGAVAVELDSDSARACVAYGQARTRDADWARPGILIEMLTSGTTGKPKRVPLKRSSFEFAFERAVANDVREAGPRLRDSVQLLTGPISHIGGVWHAVFQLTAGRRACLLEKFSVESWHDAVVRHRPKSASTPPAALRMILEAGIPKEDLSSLVMLTSGTAPLEWSVIDEVWQRYEIPVLTNYGATEFSGAPVAGWSLADYRAYREAKRGSVGRLQRGVEARVVSPETGEVLAHGEDGALEVRGPQMAASPGQWLRTTDLATLDEEGFLWIKGRLDNAIIRGGFKVHPDEIARRLERHPAIAEAAVVGVPHGRLGEVPHAALVLAPGATAPSGPELDEFLREHLAPYQIPVGYHVLADLPRTASLKPALAELRKLFAERQPA